MRLSGKVIVAAFCFFIVLTPAVLISFLASATNGAVSSIVPFWNGAIAKVVGGDAAKIRNDILLVLSSTADLLDASKTSCFAAGVSATQCASTTMCGSLLQDRLQLIKQLAFFNSKNPPNVTLVVLRRDMTIAHSGIGGGSSGGSFAPSTVACFPLNSSSAVALNTTSSIAFDAPEAWFNLVNATENVASAKPVHYSDFQFDGGIGVGLDKAAVAIAPIRASSTGSLPPEDQQLVLVLLVTCAAGTGSVYPVALGSGFSFPLVSGDDLMSPRVVCGPQLYFSSAFGSSGREAAVPEMSLAFLISQNRTSLKTNPAGVCMDLSANRFTSCSRIGDSISAVAPPEPSFLSYLFAHSAATVFSLTTSLSTLASPTALDYFATEALVSDTLGLILLVPQSTSLNQLRGAQVTSVVVGVAVTAVVIVVTMTLLHYVFHPLKVVGVLLRCCADVRLYDVEAQSPSVIEEIFVVQKATNALVKHMTLISKYMPDKSQIQNALASSALTEGGDAVPIAGSKAASKKSSTRLAVVSHAVAVRVEYRSRRSIGEARVANDTRKMCSFQFEYAHEENLLSALVDEVHERLQERQGESLLLFFHPSSVAALKGNVAAPYFPLRRESDLMQAIEFTVSNNAPCLNIIVTKSSRKDFVPWILICYSFVEATLVVISALEILASPDADKKQCGLALLFIVVCNFISNIFFVMVLVRKFARRSDAFAHWMNDAMQETLISVLCSSFCVRSIRLMFSHTRFTRALRFNAPWNLTFRPLITRMAIIGLVLGDIIPIIVVIYFLSLGGSLTAAMGTMLVLCVISAVWFFAEVFVSGEEGDPSNKSGNIFSTLNSRLQSIISPAVENNLEGSPSCSDIFELSALGRSSVESPAASPGSADVVVGDDESPTSASPTCAPKSLYLGLCSRHATVLQISLHNAVAHFDIMDAVEIQACCSAFLSHVQREVRLHGGLILRVFPNTTILIGFNCHTQLDDHLSACLNFFFSLDCVLLQSMLKWSTDDWEQPKLIGAMVSSSHCCVGYAGSGDSRNFHHVGPSHEELELIAAVGAHYGAQLVSTRRVAHAIEEGGIRVKQDVVKARIAVATASRDAAAGAAEGPDLQSSKVFCRKIDSVVSSSSSQFPTYSKEVANWRSGVAGSLSGISHRSLPRGGMKLQASSSMSTSAASWCVTVFEVLIDVALEFQSSSSVFAHVGSAGDEQVDRLIVTNALKSHCLRFPDDAVARVVLTKALSACGPREVSRLGIDVTAAETLVSEGEPSVPHGGVVKDEGDVPLAQAASQDDAGAKQNPVLSKICTSENYVLFFSEI